MTSQSARTIFITGSSSGLGRAAAKLFAARGWTVLATMRSPDKEKSLATLPNVVLLPLDITDLDQITRAVNDALARGDVDVVFNNAGYGMAGPLEGVTDEQMLRMVHTNLMGPIRVTKAFIPHFRAKRAGLFINTTSIGGLITVPFNSMYHATKWALEGWSEATAFELNQFGIGLKILDRNGRHLVVVEHLAPRDVFGPEGDVKVVVEVAVIGGHPWRRPAHSLLRRLDLCQRRARHGHDRHVVMLQMHPRAFDGVHLDRTPDAHIVLRVQHVVLDDELAAPGEQIGKAHLALRACRRHIPWSPSSTAGRAVPRRRAAVAS